RWTAGRPRTCDGAARRSGRGEMLVEHLADLRLRYEAHDPVDGLAALEEAEARDPGDAVLSGDRRRFVGVQLDERDAVAHLPGDLLDDRREHATRAAPRRPEVDQHGLGAAEHFGRKRALGDVGECAHDSGFRTSERFDPIVGGTVSPAALRALPWAPRRS